MYTVAMEGMVVTSTGFQGKDDKKELQNKVEKMGGLYSNNFHDGVTHLVAKVFNFDYNYAGLLNYLNTLAPNLLAINATVV